MLNKTIAAIATSRGVGGIAIIRVSGPESWVIAEQLTYPPPCIRTAHSTNSPTAASLPRGGGIKLEAGKIAYGWCYDPSDGNLLDEVLYLAFKAPRSFTGEDCVEIHCHGGLAVSKAILNACFLLGAIPAEPGEFTKRALLNGRIDLTQAESILDLIHAEGEALVKLSAQNLHNRSVGQLLETYLTEIIDIQTDLTASIDFPEEVGDPDIATLIEKLTKLTTEIQAHITQNQQHQVIRDGIEIAILGLPNAGKSALFNALLASDRAIVTEIAGTTRDILRETLSVNGIPVTLIDTAGLRETVDQVEILGVERSWQTLETAQAILYVLDATQGITPADEAILNRIANTQVLIVHNKADLLPVSSLRGGIPAGDTDVAIRNGMTIDSCDTDCHGISPMEKRLAMTTLVYVSAQNGEGVSDVLAWLTQITETLPNASDIGYLLSQRQLLQLGSLQIDLQQALEILQTPNLPFDLATVPLTDALITLQGLLGKDTTEAVLDAVFSRFCVGK